MAIKQERRDRDISLKLKIDKDLADMVDIVSDDTLGGAFRVFVINSTSDDAGEYTFPTGNGELDLLAKYLRKHSEVTADGE